MSAEWTSLILALPWKGGYHTARAWSTGWGSEVVLGRKGKSMLPAICIMFSHPVTLESFKELEPHAWIVSFHILSEAPLSCGCNLITDSWQSSKMVWVVVSLVVTLNLHLNAAKNLERFSGCPLPEALLTLGTPSNLRTRRQPSCLVWKPYISTSKKGSLECLQDVRESLQMES